MRCRRPAPPPYPAPAAIPPATAGAPPSWAAAMRARQSAAPPPRPEGAPLSIPMPFDWHVVILHPQIEVRTADARGALPETVPLSDAVVQSARMGAFIASCYEGDAERALFSLEDLLVTPHRQRLIPHFEQMKQAALLAGARAGGISGSGPSTFWIAKDAQDAQSVGNSLEVCMTANAIPYHIHHAQIAPQGARIMP